MTEMPSIEVERHESVPVATIAGDVDVVIATQVRNRLLEAVQNRDSGLVIDLSQVPYVDSAGINVLFELAERLGARQLQLGVVALGDSFVDRILKIVDLASVAKVSPNLDDALAHMAATSGDADRAPESEPLS